VLIVSPSPSVQSALYCRFPLDTLCVITHSGNSGRRAKRTLWWHIHILFAWSVTTGHANRAIHRPWLL